MKNTIALTVVLAISSCSFVNAARINVLNNGGGNFSVFLDGEGDVFDTIGVEILPDARFEFQNPDNGFEGFRPREPGEEFSFISGFLRSLPSLGGQGFTLLDVAIESDRITFVGGPLGFGIETTGSAEGLFLANVVLPAGGSFNYNIRLIAAGLDLGTLSGVFPIPEPTSLMLAGLGLIAFVGNRRRS